MELEGRKGDRTYAIMMLLASKDTKCATLDEILEALEPLHRKIGLERHIEIYVLRTLQRMKQRGVIRRSWIWLNIDGKKVKKRIYCLQT